MSLKQSAQRQFNKDFFWNAIGAYCRRCKYDECISALQLHHLDPKQKKGKLDTLGHWLSMDRARMVERILQTKFTIFCSNCHIKLHNILKEGKTVHLNPINTDNLKELAGRELFLLKIKESRNKIKQLAKKEKENQWCREERLKAGLPCRKDSCVGCKLTDIEDDEDEATIQQDLEWLDEQWERLGWDELPDGRHCKRATGEIVGTSR